MSAGVQRFLFLLLMLYFTLFSSTLFTELNPATRMLNQAFALGLLALWLGNLWRSKRPFPATPFDLPILLYVAAQVVSALFSQDPRISIEFVWPTLRNALFFYVLVDLMRRGRQRWVMEGLFLASAMVVLVTAVEVYAWYNGRSPLGNLMPFVQSWPQIGLGLIPPFGYKFGLAMGISTQLGNHVAVMIPLVLAWAVTTPRRDLRLAGLGLVAALGVVLLLSQSRGSLAGLGAALGVLAVGFLLRPAVRARFPKALQPLLDQRVLLAAALLGFVLLVGGLVIVTSRSAQSGDANRIDLWRSALEMARDYPILGVGPRQYGIHLRIYGASALAPSQERIAHAHNLLLQVLAEGGLVALSAMCLLLIRFFRAWARAWETARPARRLRLEGALAGLAAYAAHNVVDSLTALSLLMPIIVLMAYTLAGDVTRSEAVMARVTAQEPVPPRRRALAPALLALLLAIQLAFVPVHIAALAQGRAMLAMAEREYPAALQAVREARSIDPTLRLYPLQEAHILALLAYDDPDTYLDEAISTYEEAVALNFTWDEGYHNLAALYAQAGRYEDAMIAEQRAVVWDNFPSGYHLKLGEYAEALPAEADTVWRSYTTVLTNSLNNMAASAFWHDPDHPARAELVQDILDEVAADDPLLALHVAASGGNSNDGSHLAAAVLADNSDWSALPVETLRDLAALAVETGEGPMPYLAAALHRNRLQPWKEYILLAEQAALTGTDEAAGMTPEQAARYALFLGGENARRAYYALALLADAQGADEEGVNAWLWKALPVQPASPEYALVVYGRLANLGVLPQARTPMAFQPGDFAPLYWLEARLQAAGDTEALRRLYIRALEIDPYWLEMRARLDALPEA